MPLNTPRLRWSLAAIVFAGGLFTITPLQGTCTCSGLLEYDPLDEIVISGTARISPKATSGTCWPVVFDLMPCPCCVSMNESTFLLECGRSVNGSFEKTCYDDFTSADANALADVTVTFSGDAFATATEDKLIANFTSLTNIVGNAEIIECDSQYLWHYWASASGRVTPNSDGEATPFSVTIPFTVCEPGYYLADAILQDLGTCDGSGLGDSSTTLTGTWSLKQGSTVIDEGDIEVGSTGPRIDRDVALGAINAGDYTFKATFAVDTRSCIDAYCPDATLGSESCVSQGIFDVNIHFDTEDFTDPCPGDHTGDGVVDFSDLMELYAQWGPCPTGANYQLCTADLNFDGVVDIQDQNVLFSYWGPCP